MHAYVELFSYVAFENYVQEYPYNYSFMHLFLLSDTGGERPLPGRNEAGIKQKYIVVKTVRIFITVLIRIIDIMWN